MELSYYVALALRIGKDHWAIFDQLTLDQSTTLTNTTTSSLHLSEKVEWNWTEKQIFMQVSKLL